MELAIIMFPGENGSHARFIRQFFIYTIKVLWDLQMIIISCTNDVQAHFIGFLFCSCLFTCHLRRFAVRNVYRSLNKLC